MEIFPQAKNYLKNFIAKKFWYVLAAILLLAGILLFEKLFVILGLVGLIIISKLVETALPRSTNFDLSLFGIVVLQRAYDLSTALSVAMIAYLIGTMVKMKLSSRGGVENLILPPIGFIVVAFVTSALSLDIFTTGVIVVAVFAVMMTISYGILYDFPVMDIIIYLVTILPFNVFIFMNFAKPMLNLLVA